MVSRQPNEFDRSYEVFIVGIAILGYLLDKLELALNS